MTSTHTIACRLIAAGALAICASVAADTSKIQPELLERMQDHAEGTERRARPDRHINVIINLEPGEYAHAAELFSERYAASQRDALRQHIRQTQSHLIQRMPADAADRVSYEFQVQHALAASLTADEIHLLAGDRAVRLIEEQPVAYKFHNESHPLTGTDVMHSMGYTGDDTVIAIIDDGIQSSHPAFGGHAGFPTPKIIAGYDFADMDSDPRNDCTGQSHGTAVAGVAAGNGGGVLGTAPDARIVFLKIQSASICGQAALDGNIIGAIDWVVANKDTYGIDIISMSLGGGSFSSVCDNSHTAYRNAINAAANAGIAILAASGNEGTCNAMARPACFSNVISVGATYDAALGSSGSCVSPSSCASTQSHPTCAAIGMVACFDNAQPDGVTCYSNSASFLDILAPSNCARTAATGGGVNTCFSGTSSATPFAAGVAASLIEAAGGSGSLNNNTMRAALTDHGVAVTDSKNNRTTPRVNSQASALAVESGGGPGPGPGPSELQNGVPVTGLSGGQGSQTFYTITAPAGASNLVIGTSGGSGDVDLYVKFGSAPALGDWDCRPFQWGNNETCPFPNPGTGTYHIMLHGYSSYSGVTLVASFDQATSAPCTGCTEYTGTLSGSGASQVQPDGDYYQSPAGQHQGWLSGPAGTDFDLRLFRWSGSSWVQVASGLTWDSEEYVSYNGAAGYYYWRVESYAGSGPYSLWLSTP